MKKCQVVVIRAEFDAPTGVVRYAQMLREGLSGVREIDVHYIALNTSVRFPEITCENGCMIARIPFFSKTKLLVRQEYWQVKYFKIVTRMILPYLKGKSPIVWHVQELFIVPFADVLKCMLGGKVVTHLHIIPWKFSLEPNRKLFNKMYAGYLVHDYTLVKRDRLEKTAYDLSDRIICVSACAKRHVENVYGVDPAKVSVVYNGLRSESRPIRTDYAIRGKPAILFVGRVSREKGVLDLLKALRKVHDRGVAFRLDLVGDCSFPVRKEIEERYGDLDINLRGRLKFEELCRLYAECSVGVIPSLHEQCSYVAIEMAMFGVPLVVSDVDALSEMFRHGENALQVPLRFDRDFGLDLDENELAAGLLSLLTDESLRKKLGAGNRINFERNFTLDKMVKETIHLYYQELS